MSHVFRTRIRLEGKTGTGIEVPPEVVAALGRGKRPPVRVTIGPHTYRSTVATYGEQSFLPLSAVNRSAAGVAAGDEVEVTLDLDTAPREMAVPPDLAAALDAVPGAPAAFASLSFSTRSGHVAAVEGAKAPATRERRIARVVASVAPDGTPAA